MSCTSLGFVARKAAWPCFATGVAQKPQHLFASRPHINGHPSHGVVLQKVRAASGSQTTSSQAPGALSPDEWRSFKVVEKRQLTDNTSNKVSFVRFGLPDPNQTIGLFVASCLMTRAPIGPNNEDIIRPYTPVSRPDTKGYFDLVIKVYPQGNMSKHIGSLQVGDSLEFKGPMPKLPYRPNMKKKIGMIAGGSGITPMLQVAEEIVLNPEDKTEVSMIYANQTENDIILEDKLDEMARKHSNFRVFYVVDRAISEAEWKGGVGYITSEIVKEHMPGPEENSLVLVCGPPPMMKAISGDKAPDKTQGELTGILANMGYTKDGVFKF